MAMRSGRLRRTGYAALFLLLVLCLCLGLLPCVQLALPDPLPGLSASFDRLPQPPDRVLPLQSQQLVLLHPRAGGSVQNQARALCCILFFLALPGLRAYGALRHPLACNLRLNGCLSHGQAPLSVHVGGHAPPCLKTPSL